MHPLIEQYNQLNAFGQKHFRLLMASEGICHYQMDVKTEHLALPVSAHGGMLAALMDACTGVAALSLAAEDGNFLNTIELKIQYVSPARPGTLLDARGKVTFKGGSIIFSEGSITCGEVLIAMGTATFKGYPAQKILPYSGV